MIAQTMGVQCLDVIQLSYVCATADPRAVKMCNCHTYLHGHWLAGAGSEAAGSLWERRYLHFLEGPSSLSDPPSAH